MKCGSQIFKFSFVLNLDLLNVVVELSLHRLDLLRNEIGTVLQVTTDVTHLIIPPPKS